MITLKAEFFAEFFSRFLLQIVKLNSAKVIEIGSVAKICSVKINFFPIFYVWLEHSSNTIRSKKDNRIMVMIQSFINFTCAIFYMLLYVQVINLVYI